MAIFGGIVRIVVLVCLAGVSTASRNGIFTIAIGHDWGAHEYIDEGGVLRGFTKDMIKEVCAAAGMQCRTVWDTYINCWDSEAGQHAMGGQGLLGGWYDACTGWVGSVDRVQVFDFSMPFFKPSLSYFWIKKGARFDATDVTGRRIGFMDGWVNDEKCLARHADQIKGAVLEKNKMFHYETTDQALDALKSGAVEAVLQGSAVWSEETDITRVTDVSFTCASGGNAMMTRKDNDFNSYWNKGFQQLIASGRYRKICKSSAETHADKGDLLPCV